MIIGCKLPNGFTFEVGMPGGQYEFFNCAPGSAKKPSYTTVPDAVWNAWLKNNRKFRYVTDGSIFPKT